MWIDRVSDLLAYHRQPLTPVSDLDAGVFLSKIFSIKKAALL
jgi:hypothetical protein